MNNFSEKLINIFKEYKRTGKTRTLTEFASFIGVSRTTLREYTSGISYPKPSKRAIIVDRLNIPYEELFDDKKKSLNNNIFLKLDYLCKKHNLNYREFAKLIGVNRGYVSQVRDRITMSNEVVDKICETFDVSREWLFNDCSFEKDVNAVFNKLNDANKKYIYNLMISLLEKENEKDE